METRGENHADVWTSLTGYYALPEAQGHGERFVLLPSPACPWARGLLLPGILFLILPSLAPRPQL